MPLCLWIFAGATKVYFWKFCYWKSNLLGQGKWGRSWWCRSPRPSRPVKLPSTTTTTIMKLEKGEKVTDKPCCWQHNQKAGPFQFYEKCSSSFLKWSNFLDEIVKIENVCSNWHKMASRNVLWSKIRKLPWRSSTKLSSSTMRSKLPMSTKMKSTKLRICKKTEPELRKSEMEILSLKEL